MSYIIIVCNCIYTRALFFDENDTDKKQKYLDGGHFKNSLILASTNIRPNIPQIIDKHQCQQSHKKVFGLLLDSFRINFLTKFVSQLFRVQTIYFCAIFTQ